MKICYVNVKLIQPEHLDADHFDTGWPQGPDHNLESCPGPPNVRSSPSQNAGTGNLSFQHYPPIDTASSPVPMSVTSESSIARHRDFN